MAGELSVYSFGGLSIYGNQITINPLYTKTILPLADNTYDVGSATFSYRQGHFETAVYATSVVGNWSPSADDNYDLGENSTPLEWKDGYFDGILYMDDASVPNGFSMVSEVTAFSHFDHDNGAWHFFTKTSAAAQLSRLRIPNGTDSVDIAMANANLLFGSGYGIRANAANGTIVDFEAYENGAYVTVANMNSSATLANWVFSRPVNIADDTAFTIGTTLDSVFYHKTGANSADAEITGVIVGTSDISATTANSLFISNITTDGDILIAVSDGGHSKQMLFLDGSTGITHLGKPGSPGNAISSGDVYTDGALEVDGTLYADAGMACLSHLDIKADDKRLSFGADTDCKIQYETADADAKILQFSIDESDDAGNNVPVFAFMEETGAFVDFGLFDAFVQPLVCVLDNDKDSYFGITMTADDTPALGIGGAATGIEIQGTIGVVQRMAYAQILEILGDCSFFFPMTDATGTTVTDFTANGHDGTPSKDVGTWDTTPAYQGSIQVYDADGVDEEFDVADHADFSTATAMSCGGLVKLTTSANSTLMGVWDAQTKREWRLYFDASGYPTFAAYDEGNAAQIGRQDQTDIGTASYHTVIATFDGATVSAGIIIYVDGVALDDADVEAGSGFANQVDSGAALDVFFNEDGASAAENYYDGAAGLLWMTKKELSADEAWNIHQIYRGLANF